MRFCLLILFFLLSSSPNHAAPPLEREGAKFTGTVSVNGEDLELEGLGIAKYLIYKVYVAGLYLPPGKDTDSVLSLDVAKRLELHYLYKVGKKDVVEIAQKYLLKNLSAEEMSNYGSQIAAVHKLFRDVTPGERCALTYVPNGGLSVAYNGKEVGSVKGDDFANAYLRIWFGENPSSKGMLKELQKSSKKGS